YIGLFPRAVPLLLFMLVALAVPVRLAAGALLAAGLAGMAVTPTLVTQREYINNLPHVVAVLKDSARGRPVVLEINHRMWPELNALVIGGERRGLRVCARDPRYRFMVSPQFLCTARDLAVGERVWLHWRGEVPPGASALVDVGFGTASVGG